MRRSWVTIEQGEQVELAAERLQRVVDGTDPSGVTKVEDWTGGGHFTRRSMND